MAPQTKTQVKNALDATLAGGVTQAQLDTWKEQYKEVHIVTVTVDDNTVLTGYFKKPNRPILANCVNLSSTGQLFEAKEFLWNNSKLGGDPQIFTNEDAAISGQNQLWKGFTFLKAEAVKY